MSTHMHACWLLALALASGCGGDSEPASSAPGEAQQTAESQPPPKAKGAKGSKGTKDGKGGKNAAAKAEQAPAAEAPASPSGPVTEALAGPEALAALRTIVLETAARPEHTDPTVEVTHILVAFEGAERSRVQGRTKEQAEQRAAEFYARVLAGEDFEAVRATNTDDPGPPTYKMALTKAAGAYPRGQMAPAFGDVGWRLEVGEVGVAAHQPKASPFGWHIIKRVK